MHMSIDVNIPRKFAANVLRYLARCVRDNGIIKFDPGKSVQTFIGRIRDCFQLELRSSQI